MMIRSKPILTVRERIHVIDRNFASARKGADIIPVDFNAFISLLNKELVHSLFYFNEWDEALFISLQKHLNNTANKSDYTALVIIIDEVLWARDNHKLAQVVSLPNKYKSKSANDWAKICYGLRYRQLCKSLYDLAEDFYSKSYQNEQSLFAMVRIAQKGAEEDRFDDLRGQYIKQYRGSDHYPEVYRLEFQ